MWCWRFAAALPPYLAIETQLPRKSLIAAVVSLQAWQHRHLTQAALTWSASPAISVIRKNGCTAIRGSRLPPKLAERRTSRSHRLSIAGCWCCVDLASLAGYRSCWRDAAECCRCHLNVSRPATAAVWPAPKSGYWPLSIVEHSWG